MTDSFLKVTSFDPLVVEAPAGHDGRDGVDGHVQSVDGQTGPHIDLTNTYVSRVNAIAGWALAGSFALSGSQTYDATFGTLTGASITWPDGATGVFASTGIDSTSTNPGGLTGFTATHVVGPTTLTATVVIPRNGSGQVSGAMTVTVA